MHNHVCRQTDTKNSDQRPGLWDRLSILPIPFFLFLLFILYFTGSQTSYESPYLLIALNSFSMPVSFFVYYHISTIFVLHSKPGWLLFGCGVMIWGCAGFAATVAGLFNTGTGALDANTAVTVFNCCVWVSAMCHLTGVAMSLKISRPLSFPRACSMGMVLIVIIFVVSIIVAATYNLLPPFFIPGQGGTLVRQFVLGSAISMFVLTAILLRLINIPGSYSSVHWYSLGLLLLAIGLTGVWLGNVTGSPLNWSGRLAQYLGSFYTLVSTIKFIRNPETEGIISVQRLTHARKKLGIAASIALAATFSCAALRLLFFQSLEMAVPYLSFFPAVILSAIYGGLYSGLIATALSAALIHYLAQKSSTGLFFSGDSTVLLGMALFIANGIIISFISRALHSAQKRALEAETARYAMELEQAARELQESRSKYKAMIGSFVGLIYICSPEYRITFMNERLKQRTGYDATGESCYKIMHGLDAVCPWCVNDRIKNGESIRWEIKSPKDDRWYEVSDSPVYNPDGSVSKQGMITDITERKEAEEALRQAHEELEQRVLERTSELESTVKELREKEHLLLQQGRLAAMGEMVSNIAHQWRQPLNTLGLIIQNLEFSYDIGEFDKTVLAKSTKDSMRLICHMSQTIDDFRYFFKPLKNKEDFRVSNIIGNAIELIEASFSSYNITIHQQYPNDPQIHGYPNEYAQVVLNLLTNAKDAFLKNRIPDPVLLITSDVIEGKSVVTVKDNAGGIPEEFINKIFEPYFTTKGTQGTGIGLFMSKNIIEKNMDGTITALNTSDGVQFTISVTTTSPAHQLVFDEFSQNSSSLNYAQA